MNKFWQKLKYQKKPFFVLAPMEKATDTIFRQIISIAGKPDAFFTEFTNVDGLFSEGRRYIERRLKFTESEHPIIAQIWGLKPDNFYKAAKLCNESGFDGIDINMGCPESSAISKGACAALINNKPLASEIIKAVREGAGDLPVSVKTRIGFSTISTTEWIGFLLEQDLDALIIHGRTKKEMSKVPAHWDEIHKSINLRDALKKSTVIIGNGDVKDIKEGIDKARQYGVDGIMIGRGIFENAWVFNKGTDASNISIENRINILKQHLELYEIEKGEKLPYNTLKKYFKIYIRDFDGAMSMRTKLMETKSVFEAKTFINKLAI